MGRILFANLVSLVDVRLFIFYFFPLFRFGNLCVFSILMLDSHII